MQSVKLKRPTLWTPPVYQGTDKQLQEKENRLLNRLVDIAADHQSPRFASSLAAEDMVLTDVILRLGPTSVRQKISIFSLDTGRLPKKTLAMIDTINQHYQYSINLYYPQSGAVEDYITQHGLNAFYDSVEQRKLCCRIRKVEPLSRALADADAWLTGQRREQAVTRQELALSEYDQTHRMHKYNPLADWSEAEIWAYLHKHQVPVNALHTHGYPSIGCDPCTTTVKAGEDIRAGRWWWESRDTKECGLHVTS